MSYLSNVFKVSKIFKHAMSELPTLYSDILAYMLFSIKIVSGLGHQSFKFLKLEKFRIQISDLTEMLKAVWTWLAG